METLFLENVRQTHRTIRQKHATTLKKACLQVFANQLFILGYPSATPDNHQQNLLSPVVNQPLILGYSSITPDNCQQCWSLAVVNQPLALALFILGTSFDTILIWYPNIQHIDLRDVVNEMLTKQNINYLLFLFYNVIDQLSAKPSNNRHV